MAAHASSPSSHPKGELTILQTAGEHRVQGAVAFPIFQSANFEYDGEGSYHDLKYIRLNNTPNHRTLSEKIAALEHAEACLVTASGMGAVSTALLSVLKTGDHIIAQNALYGGTYTLITKDFIDLGIEHTLVDGDDPASWEKALRPTTKVIYMETLTNPLIEMADHKAVVAFAKKHNLVSIIDNTFATPLNFRPIEAGYDLALHSATKYLNGHTDIVAGALVGSKERIERALHKLNHFGACLDPHAAFLLQRGLKTLAVRMRQHQENALEIAQFLSAHPRVRSVNYPGLPSSRFHARAKELFRIGDGSKFAGFGGMLSFALKAGAGEDEGALAAKLVDKLTLPVKAPSLGATCSLVTIPAKTSHAGLTKEERHKAGIGEGLVRFSVGLEDAADIIADLKSALDSLAA